MRPPKPDNVEFLREWIADIHKNSNFFSTDAAHLERCVEEIENLRLHRDRLQRVTTALGELIAMFDGHPYLACEDGELPPLDRARNAYTEATGTLANECAHVSAADWQMRLLAK